MWDAPDAPYKRIVTDLESTLPLIGIGHDETITAWNGPAARLLQIAPEDALGRPCHSVLRGRDVHGNPYCGPRCPILRARETDEPVRLFELRVRSGQQFVAMRIAPIRDASCHYYLIVSSELEAPPEDVEGSTAPGDASLLSLRELEILRRLATGRGTKEIAHELFLSPHTVRNHVQRILQKLGAHSRLEAIALAKARTLL